VPVDREVDEELAFHLEMRTRELIARGIDPKTAREMALARAGDLGRLKRTCVDLGRKREREMRLTRWLEECRDDVKFAVRQLKASPGFTFVAVLTLALGIGANSAMFALADAALLRPLPFAEPERLVMVSERRGDASGIPVNPLDFVDWSERNRTFTALTAVLQSGTAMTGEDGTAEQIPAQAVTPRFFEVFGLTPIAGRTFVPDDQLTQDVVVLSEGFWRRRFGADPALVGQTLRLSGRPFTVVGVVPDLPFVIPGFPSAPSSLWTVLNTPRDRSLSQRYAHYFRVVGRLAPGVTLDAARADMEAVAEGIAREAPSTNEGHGVAIEPLRDSVVSGELRLTSMLLLGVVGFVLLLCCANVANLLLARVTGRARELAVRSALGAGRRRIIRQLLTESLVLATLGAILGIAIGVGLLQAASALMPPGLLPAVVPLAFDSRVLAFCAIAACVVAIAFGLVPAWHAAGGALTRTDDSRTATPRARVQRLLAGAEVAVAVLLLCGAGLLLRTLLALEDVDSGARARNMLTMIVSPEMSNDTEYLRQYYEALEREVRSVATVRQVAWGSALPFAGQWYGQSFHIDGEPPGPQANRDGAAYQMVSASYFETLDIPVLAGRAFDERDGPSAVQVCIVDEAFVRRYLQGRDPLRTRLVVNAMAQPPQAVVRQIVGVVPHVKERPDETNEAPAIYVPLAQNTWWSASLIVQPQEGLAAALTPAIRAAVARVDRDRPVTFVRTLEAIAADATARPRFRAALVGAFAGLALLLAVVGVFGVLAYSVEQRRRELGIRLALGAGTLGILKLVVGSTSRLIAAGAVVGFVAAAGVGQLISSFLFGVEPLDLSTFGSAALLLTITAAIATAVPALRATRVDPAVTFRSE
jgi:putative ABC transport system permease protein